MIIAFAIFSKPVIITDDECMRMKFFYKKIVNVFFCRLLRKSFGEWNDNKMINFFISQQIYFFIQCIYKFDFFCSNNFSWVRMKSDDYSFSVYFFCLFF